jgi:hypothetical protein
MYSSVTRLLSQRSAVGNVNQSEEGDCLATVEQKPVNRSKLI